MAKTKWQRRVMGLVGALAFPLALGVPLQVFAAGGEEADPYQDKVEELAQQLRSLPGPSPVEVLQARQSLEEPQSGEVAPAPMMARALAAAPAATLVGPLNFPGFSHGDGYHWRYAIDGVPAHWLGALDVDGEGEWCIDFTAEAPTGKKNPQTVSLQQVPSGIGSSSALQLQDNDQMAYVLAKYGTQSDAGVRAATSVLAHLNYEVGGGRAHLGALVNTLNDTGGVAGPIIAEMAGTMAADARKNTAEFTAGNASFSASENRQTFDLLGLGVESRPGNWVAGVDMTVTLSGPATFNRSSISAGTLSPDGKTWAGKTASSPISLAGSSSGNGTVKANVEFGRVATPSVLSGFSRPNGTQTTITQVPGTKAVLDPPTPTEEVLHDFQPVLVSSTAEAGAKFVEQGASVIADSLQVKADPTYSNPLWLGKGGTLPGQPGYVPLNVKFTGTAYYVGERPASPAARVPVGAEAVATAELIAAGPGTYRVEAKYDAEPGFIVWVWKMETGDQPQVAEADRHLIAADWSDGYGVAAEHSLVRYSGKVESNLTVKPTIDNTYLVDDVWISGLPADHPNFAGAAGYGADTKTIEQKLYFWPEGTEVESLENATQIGQTLTIPAKNGVYLGQADLSWKVMLDQDGKPIRGTYQVVHSFAGDDRVLPFSTHIPDETEQFTVTGNPQIGTTATGPENKKVLPLEKKVVLTDSVCYLDLIPGAEYVLEGVLMDGKTGKKLLSGGETITSEATFTPTEADGCVDVEFQFDSRSMGDTTIVVFEELLKDGDLVAMHADLNDRGQTVLVEPEVPQTGELAKTGSRGTVFMALGATFLIAGTGLTLLSRRARR